ncbi:STM4504/CBY_0614 family protein [Acidovorax delafieldii]|uniref:STM4504/CBY_0614 family protein n=1 Tax=Acidovorax delafieldii TaxID=47920 RepID=UPI003757F1D6
MPILDIFSKRQAKLRGEVPDVFVYDSLPQELRVQIVHIFRDSLGDEQEADARGDMVSGAYEFIVNSLCREYGLFKLPGAKDYGRREYVSELFTFILNEKLVERVLDAVELACKIIDIHSRKWEYRHRSNADKEATAALEELNARFQHHGFGYRFEAGDIIRVDSEIVHAEVIKPALTLLHAARFKGAEAEFHQAYEHYRHGRMKESLTDCLKALENTMKSIAATRKWKHDQGATAKPLIDLMFEKQLVPTFWSQHFSALRAMLEAGVPTARNRLGGHGQGTTIVDVPPHFVAFALHQTAAAIVFLAKADSELS